MVKLAVSNIALPPYDHAAQLASLPGLGLRGLEVAPSRAWRDTWHGLGSAQVRTYRDQVEKAGLEVVGLHSLFFDHPELGLFRGPETRRLTMDFLVHLSAVCRDLGGRTLIYGAGRRRGRVPPAEAEAEAVAFCQEFCHRIESHGTCLCFEPLGPEDSDFINSALDALSIVRQVDHSALRVQLDAKALVANNEVGIETFRAVAEELVHFHANEPGLAVLGESGQVDHAAMGQFLAEIGYAEYVSIEQRMFNENDVPTDLARSARVLCRDYASGPT